MHIGCGPKRNYKVNFSTFRSNRTPAKIPATIFFIIVRLPVGLQVTDGILPDSSQISRDDLEDAWVAKKLCKIVYKNHYNRINEKAISVNT